MGGPWGTPSGFFGQEEESERYDGSGSEASSTGGKCQTKSWGVENLEFPNTIFNMMAVKQTVIWIQPTPVLCASLCFKGSKRKLPKQYGHKFAWL